MKSKMRRATRADLLDAVQRSILGFQNIHDWINRNKFVIDGLPVVARGQEFSLVEDLRRLVRKA